MLNTRTGRPVLFLAFAGVFLLSPLTFAQNTDSLPSIEKKRPNSLKPGAWALQFQITQDFTLRDFQGMVISAKRHYSEGKAIRLGFGLRVNANSGKDEDEIFQIDTLVDSRSGHRESNTQAFDVTTQYVTHTGFSDRTKFYFGTGPLGSFSRSKYNSSYSDGSRSSQTTISWAVGMSTPLGVEWFATQNISFLAEYGLVVKYSWSRITYRSSSGIVSNNRKSTQDSFDINPAIVKLGLSVYF
jgi:hypothetical protein